MFIKFYENHILPTAIEYACGNESITNERMRLIPLAEGQVLEIGMGSGLNLPYYIPGKIRQFWGLEPSQAMLKKAAARISLVQFDIRLLDLPGEAIPLDDESVDMVVMTYALCTIPDGQAALQQIRRVLKTGGKLLFAEHGLAPDSNTAKWQNRINPFWKRVGGGCNLNRPIDKMIIEAGFEIIQLEKYYLDSVPRIAGFHYRGIAVK